MNAQLQPEAPRLGIFTDEPADTYYQRVLGEASNSALTIIDERSPAHYLHWVNHPDDDEETAALTFGKAFHMATLEPERFGDTYGVLPVDAPRDLRHLRNAKTKSDSTLESIEWWDNWTEANAGRVMLSSNDYAKAAAMGASLRAYEMDFNGTVITGADLFDACQKEVTVRWVDEETGLLCKLRADIWSEELALAGDLKSCLDGSFEAFSKAIYRHRYHVQQAHYSEGFRAAGFPLRSFPFFPVEKDAPHVPASWHIDGPAEERGWALRQRSMRKLKACMESGRWPGHTTTVQSISLPAFAFYDAKESA